MISRTLEVEGLLKEKGKGLLLLHFVERQAGSGEAGTGEIPGDGGRREEDTYCTLTLRCGNRTNLHSDGQQCEPH